MCTVKMSGTLALLLHLYSIPQSPLLYHGGVGGCQGTWGQKSPVWSRAKSLVRNLKDFIAKHYRWWFYTVIEATNSLSERPFIRDYPGEPVPEMVKQFWILLEQETMGGSDISWTICMSASCSRQIPLPSPHHSVFLQAGCPSCRPTNSVKALKDDFCPQWVFIQSEILRTFCISWHSMTFISRLALPQWASQNTVTSQSKRENEAKMQYCDLTNCYLAL